jgi:hypothetical protein
MKTDGGFRIEKYSTNGGCVLWSKQVPVGSLGPHFSMPFIRKLGSFINLQDRAHSSMSSVNSSEHSTRDNDNTLQISLQPIESFPNPDSSTPSASQKSATPKPWPSTPIHSQKSVSTSQNPCPPTPISQPVPANPAPCPPTPTSQTLPASTPTAQTPLSSTTPASDPKEIAFGSQPILSVPVIPNKSPSSMTQVA